MPWNRKLQRTLLQREMLYPKRSLECQLAVNAGGNTVWIMRWDQQQLQPEQQQQPLQSLMSSKSTHESQLCQQLCMHANRLA